MKYGRARNRFRFARNRRRGRCASARFRRLWFEALEERRMLAPLVVTPYDGASSGSLLTAALVSEGTGLSIVDSSFRGVTGQAGFFSGFEFGADPTSTILSQGILLTTGLVESVAGSNDTANDSSDNLDRSGDPDLDDLVGATTADAAVLTIRFTATTTGIEFEFVFGSEEFPEYVGSYNDVFAAYLDGVQISFDPDGRPFTVNNNFFLLNNSGDTSDSDTEGKTPVTFDLDYDGLTPALVTQAVLDPAFAIHELKLVIADAGDSSLNSGVFLANLHGINEVDADGPIADAGGDYLVSTDSSVLLDASGSSDPDQAAETLVYRWDLDGDGIFGETGEQAVRGDEVGISPTFSTIGLQAGAYVVMLRVTDSTNRVDSDEANVMVTNGLPPDDFETAPTITDTQEPIEEAPNDDDVEAVEPVIKFGLLNVTAVELSIGDAGSGGQLIGVQGPTNTPEGGAPPRDMILDALSASAPVTDEIVDAVYALAEIEVVTLVGYDMGDEPVLRKKPSEETKKEVPDDEDKPVVVVVQKVPVTVESSWEPLLWSALAGGGTLWLGGAWWWRGHRRQRRFSGEITG